MSKIQKVVVSKINLCKFLQDALMFADAKLIYMCGQQGTTDMI